MKGIVDRFFLSATIQPRFEKSHRYRKKRGFARMHHRNEDGIAYQTKTSLFLCS
jgi:hypothetical protein